jgi:hypothetical protein
MSHPAVDSVLTRYPRAAAHMWRQLSDGRLGLIFGAGVSKSFNFPTWPELVSRVANDADVLAGPDFTDSSALPLPILTEVLFQRYREGHRTECEAVSKSIGDVDRLLLAGWRRVIHRALYAGTPTSSEELMSIDSVYRHYLNPVLRAALTVTYNFDDVLERMLLASRTNQERERSQTFQTVVDARLPFRQGQTVILHPNGYLPHNLLELSSETLVFSEGTFADQLIDVMAGQYSTMLHYFTKNTFLLLGLSLDDETLRHLLRQSAILSPGSFHYFVRFVDSNSKVSADVRRAEVASNFETYNLITLYLDLDEIRALGDILNTEADDLTSRADELGARLNYTYYLAGVPGVGKTTTFSHFNTLVTHDEWLEPRLALMSKPFTELTPGEENVVDEWILRQVGLKNRRMLDDVIHRGIGIHLVDRCPPDAITFSRPDEWSKKANEVLRAISPGQASRRIHDGHVILLAADPKEIVVRAALREKVSSVQYTIDRMKDLATLYGGAGTTQLSVDRMSPTQVVRAVARIVFFGEYAPCLLHERVEKVRDGLLVAPDYVVDSEIDAI